MSQSARWLVADLSSTELHLGVYVERGGLAHDRVGGRKRQVGPRIGEWIGHRRRSDPSSVWTAPVPSRSRSM